MKNLGKALLIVILISSAQASMATGLQLPETSILSYAFTCGSGASGQVSYVRSSPNGTHRKLVLMVNGTHFEDEPKLVALLKDKSIESVGSGCEPDSTVVHFQTWDNNGTLDSGRGILSIRINKAGKVVAIGT